MKNIFRTSILFVCALVTTSISLSAQNMVQKQNEPINCHSCPLNGTECKDTTAINDTLCIQKQINASEQENKEVYNKGFFLGISGSLASGVCTYTSDKPGFQGNILVGYRFSKLISIEAGFGLGKLDISARKCCSNHPGINNERNSYWRSFYDNEWHVLPLNGTDGSWYQDMTGETKYYKGVLQANFNVLSFLYDKDEFENWNLELSPRVGFMKTKTTLTGPGTLSGSNKSIDNDQTHFIWGGQASVAYNFKNGIGVGLYGAVDMLTGDHFDYIPEHVHSSNHIWDLGLKLTYTFCK